jgi:single-strand DNA-binding protein
MAGFQQLIVSGNLAKDPETKYTTSGAQITEISIPVSEKCTDKQGQQQENTEWFNISFWNKSAEVISQYMSKGSGITCTCKIKTQEWQDSQTGDKRTAKKYQGLSFTFVGGKPQGSNDQGGYQRNQQPANTAQNQPKPPPQNQPQGRVQNNDFDDDIPF